MTTNYHTPHTSAGNLDAAGLNGPLSQLDDAIGKIIDGTTTLAAKVTDFSNAQHDHEDAAGGGQLALTALDVSAGSDGEVPTVASGVLALAAAASVPTGTILEFAGSSLPSGFLWCNGAAVSASSYADLYAALGDSHVVLGAFDGTNVITLSGTMPSLTASDTISIADYDNKSPVFKTGVTIVSVIGNQVTINPSSGSGGGLPGAQDVVFWTDNGKFILPDRRGQFGLGADNMAASGSANRVTALQADNVGCMSGAEDHTLTISEMPAHDHNAITGFLGAGTSQFAGGGGSGTAVLASEGGGSAHNNMPPYQTVNFIIKT